MKLLSTAFGLPFALVTLTLWLAAALAVESALPRRTLVLLASGATAVLAVIVLGRFAQVA